jgi:copine 1/2/3
MNTDSWFDFWDKSDPYIKLFKIRKDKTLVEAIRTEVVKENLNPSWKEFEVSQARLIREDNPEQMFKVECWDWEEAG